MRSLLGSLIVLALLCTVTPAADPTPEDAVKLLDKLKAKHRPKGKSAESVIFVDTVRKKITDDNLKTIATLKKVRELNLGGVVLKEMGDKKIYDKKQITDEGLKNLADMTELRELILDGTNITDAGLKYLSKMTKLERLVLSYTKVTDEGMVELTKLPKLDSVQLYNTAVTDAGIGTLKRWKIDLKIGK